MPFTPFHLGPGAALKAVGGSRFSFLVFAGSQVLMDIEPLVRIIRGDPVVHGISHTVLGALIIALAAGAIGRPVSEFFLRTASFGSSPITWPVAFASAFLGTYSHVGLDAIMHADMNPLWPFAVGNGLLRTITLEALHVACVVAGLIGVVIIVLWNLLSARRMRGD
jgi:hypothetical protein